MVDDPLRDLPLVASGRGSVAVLPEEVVAVEHGELRETSVVVLRSGPRYVVEGYPRAVRERLWGVSRG